MSAFGPIKRRDLTVVAELAIQATASGLFIHQMAGFNIKRSWGESHPKIKTGSWE